MLNRFLPKLSMSNSNSMLLGKAAYSKNTSPISSLRARFGTFTFDMDPAGASSFRLHQPLRQELLRGFSQVPLKTGFMALQFQEVARPVLLRLVQYAAESAGEHAVSRRL